MLDTVINGTQASQRITVTYTDNATSTFTQSFSDWCSTINGDDCPGTGSKPGESIAVVMRNTKDGGDEDRIFNLYSYSFDLNNTKIVKSLTLPNNRDVVVLAVTLTGQAAAPTGALGGRTGSK